MKQLVHSFDQRLTAWVQSLPGWVGRPMVAASFIGLPATVVVVGVLFVLLALSSHNQKPAFSMVAALLALGSLGLLKRVLRRVRPDTPYVQKYQLIDYSFPSGHSSGALLVYGLLSYLAYTHLATPWSTLITLVLAATAFSVGLSRVYLGAHYPTDVLGAWTLAGLYLILIIKLARV